MTLSNFQHIGNKKRLLAIIIITLVIVIFLMIGKLSRNIPEVDGREFTVDREILQINGIDKGVQLGGQCVKKYYLQLMGVNGGRRYFALTFDLVSNPKDEGQLAKVLTTSLCKKEIAKVLIDIKNNLPQDKRQDSDVLIHFYRNNSGMRFLP